MHPRSRWLIGLVLVLLLLSGCGVPGGGQVLSFTTILQGDILRGYPYGDEKPALLVIANAREIDDLIRQLGNPPPLQLAPQLVEQLRHLDYTHVFAILVLQGVKGSGGYRVTVRQVTRQDDQVVVQAEFVGPGPTEGRTGVITDPYHLVAVTKEGAWGRPIHFVLVVNGQVVVETTHLIS